MPGAHGHAKDERERARSARARARAARTKTKNRRKKKRRPAFSQVNNDRKQQKKRVFFLLFLVCNQVNYCWRDVSARCGAHSPIISAACSATGVAACSRWYTESKKTNKYSDVKKYTWHLIRNKLIVTLLCCIKNRILYI